MLESQNVLQDFDIKIFTQLKYQPYIMWRSKNIKSIFLQEFTT